MELISLDSLAKVLEEYAIEVRNLYQDKLIENDRIASGDLLNSIEYEVEVLDNKYVVSLNLEDYWKYVEWDTKPHFPPVNALLNWIKIKPVLPTPNGKKKLPTPNQLAYLIGSRIAKRGTKGSHDMEEAIAEVKERYKDKMVRALSSDMNDYIYKTVIEPFK